MSSLRDIVPSMFHRRLMLLGLAMLLSVSALGAQLTRLSILEGERWLQEAQAVLSRSELLPTVRGRILDRKGRPLAFDEACDDVMVDYPVLTGEWAYRRGRLDAYRENADRWARLSFEQREQLIRRARIPYDNRVDRLWQELARVGRVDEAELERRKEAILQRVHAIRADVWDRQARRRAAERSGPIELSDVAIRIRDEVQAHTILPAVNDRVARYFRKREDPVLPGLHVRPAKRRAYPWREVTVVVDRSTLPLPLRSDRPLNLDIAGVGDHVVGDMRNVWAEDVDPRQGGRPFRRNDGSVDLGGYLPGDRIGLRGVEAAAEERLHGARGRITRHRVTNEQSITDPRPGRDATLSLDIRLQARIQAILDPRLGLTRVQPWHKNKSKTLRPGDTLNASVTVLDVETGEVLALVSSPASPDPIPPRSNRSVSEPHGERPPANDALDWPNEYDNAAINRPIAAVYPPGSTLKPIVYTLAAARGAIQHRHTIQCDGHYLPNRPTVYRCWIFKNYQSTHGPLEPVEAIARSCNIYFYTCGDRLGAERLVEGLARFGFGRKPGIGLPGEHPGILPGLDGDNPPGRALSRANAIQIGIGQGPIAVTPLQVAAAHAALARDGVHMSPLLLRRRLEQQRVRPLDIPPTVVENALRGMHASANESFGTAHHISFDQHGRQPILTLDNAVLYAKTGTADAPDEFDDLNRNGRRDPGEPTTRSGSHAWYVCHAAKPDDRRPRFVIVALVEYGGSGGRAAGPLANQVLHALRAEGYL